MQAFPEAAQVACFDTAFHRAHPFIADTFALPRQFYDEGVRRYGFHGLSYEFIARRLRTRSRCWRAARSSSPISATAPRSARSRRGRSVASTMGFTALDGLPMGTRCGQLDPGVVLYLMSEKKMSAGGDLRPALQGIRPQGHVGHLATTCARSKPRPSRTAKDAIDYFVSRVRREIGGLSAVLGGLDCHRLHRRHRRERLAHPQSRARRHGMDRHSCRSTKPMPRSERIISAKGSPVVALILKTDEERMIAEHTAEILGLIRSMRPRTEPRRSLPRPDRSRP